MQSRSNVLDVGPTLYKCYINALCLPGYKLLFSRDDLNNLSYLTLCIKECMRLHSPVPMIGREVDREFVMDGVTLAPGTFVEINIHALHHNKAVWGEDHNVNQSVYSTNLSNLNVYILFLIIFYTAIKQCVEKIII